MTLLVNETPGLHPRSREALEACAEDIAASIDVLVPILDAVEQVVLDLHRTLAFEAARLKLEASGPNGPAARQAADNVEKVRLLYPAESVGASRIFLESLRRKVDALLGHEHR